MDTVQHCCDPAAEWETHEETFQLDADSKAGGGERAAAFYLTGSRERVGTWWGCRVLQLPAGSLSEPIGFDCFYLYDFIFGRKCWVLHHKRLSGPPTVLLKASSPSSCLYILLVYFLFITVTDYINIISIN